MPSMIDLIRASAVPANLMQSAARGALSVPNGEMIEILVYLATHNSAVADQAKLTLANWDPVASHEASGNPSTPKEVLDYWVAPQNFRPALLPTLLANPAIGEESLAVLAGSISRDLVDAMLKNDRIRRSRMLLTAIASNPNLSGIQSNLVEERIASLASQPGSLVVNAVPEPTRLVDSSLPPNDSPDEVDPDEVDPDVAAYLTANAGEIAAAAGKPFQAIGGIYEEADPVKIAAEEPAQAQPAAAPKTEEAPKTEAAPKTEGAAHKKPATTIPERGSALQKIAKLDVTGRIQLAMKGSKEERSLLVRDGTKIVALAVLDSPKVSDGEVEKIASQKNVLEAVLRQITMKRKFMKNYAIIRNLVFNPRTPLDVALPLMKNLLVNDLKNLSGNKEVPDTIRKLAFRMFKQKLDTKKD
jgi:hypothetical protein